MAFRSQIGRNLQIKRHCLIGTYIAHAGILTGMHALRPFSLAWGRAHQMAWSHVLAALQWL